MKKLLILFATLFCTSLLTAQDSLKTNYISLELDPAPFFLGGYSFSVKYSPKNLSKTTFMASIFSSDFPNSMMTSANKDLGWTNLKMDISYAFFTDFFIRNDRQGFHFGPSIFLYNKHVVLSTINERTKFSTLYPNFRAGYIWYPNKKIDLYLNPWVNMGSEINLDNTNELNGVAFTSTKFNYIVAIHLGYSLNW